MEAGLVSLGRALGHSLCADKEVTRDCIHEMLMEIWSNRQELPEVTHVGYYLKTYLKRKVFAPLKKERHHPIDGFEEMETTIEFSYEDLLVYSENVFELKEKIRNALCMLSQRQVEIIKMKFFECMSCEEIAALNATAPRSVYNQVYKSLKILSKMLKVFLVIAP